MIIAMLTLIHPRWLTLTVLSNKRRKALKGIFEKEQSFQKRWYFGYSREAILKINIQFTRGIYLTFPFSTFSSIP